MTRHALELVGTFSDAAAARALARDCAGVLYADERPNATGLPFRALVSFTTDDLDMASATADTGLYLVARRVIKPGPPSVVALFPMLRNPAMSHAQADAHWRDVHAPLALEHHAFMTSYNQLSVLHCFSGPELDGFAACGFQSEADLREKFFTSPASEPIIGADVVKFANMKAAPKRLIAIEERFGG